MVSIFLIVMPGLDPGIHQLSHEFLTEDGLPGQVFSPGTSPTGVRADHRHMMAWIGLPTREALHAVARGVGYGTEKQFVRLALQDGVNRRELFRRFGIHPATGYKWLDRWKAGQKDLADRSRRPQTSRSAAMRRSRTVSWWYATLILRGEPARLCVALSGMASRHQQRRQLIRFCAGMAASFRLLGEKGLGKDLRSRRQIFSGKWTSRAGSSLRMEGIAIH